jgi:hypothetical protein
MMAHARFHDVPEGSAACGDPERRTYYAGVPRSDSGARLDRLMKAVVVDVRDGAACQDSFSGASTAASPTLRDSSYPKADVAQRPRPRSANAAEDAQYNQTWCKVTVSAEPHMRIRNADPRWLQLFGFSLGEVLSKSLRICSGPKTKLATISTLLAKAGSSSCAPTWVTMYEKSGDEICLVVRAALGEDGSGDVVLEMQGVNSLGQDEMEVGQGDDAVLIVESEPPHTVRDVNAAFETLFGVAKSRVKERGMAVVFGASTSLVRWKNLLRYASGGASRSCMMTLKDSAGQDVIVVMEISPGRELSSSVAHGPHRTVQVRLSKPRDLHSRGSTQSIEAACSYESVSEGAASSSSSWSTGSDGSSGSSYQSTRSSTSAAAMELNASVANIEATERAHLRAFLAAGRRRKEPVEAGDPKMISSSDGL